MSERSLFGIRYAFPGYSFLLFFIFSQSISLWYIIVPPMSEFFNFIISVTLLLSGAPIGFFTSQLWYWDYKRKRRIVWKVEEVCLTKYMDYLVNEINDNIKIRIDDERRAIAIYDYIMQKYRADNVSKYQQRRWDLYHAMGATKISIFLGLSLGVFFKCIMNYFFDIGFMKIHNYDIFIWMILLIISIALCLMLDNAMNKIIEEHEEMAYLVLTQIDKYLIRKIKRKLGNSAKEYFLH